MIGDTLPVAEAAWLSRFFSPPNQLLWQDIERGDVEGAVADQLKPWFAVITRLRPGTPILLPFMRGGAITGWYAAHEGEAGAGELAADLEAWFGASFASRLEVVPQQTNDTMARVLRERFGGPVYRFTGPTAPVCGRIGQGVRNWGRLLAQRPDRAPTIARPVGVIRSDFERALLAQDAAQAHVFLAELRDTGRLNQWNLQFLKVRMSAGLGHWPFLARDRWLIRNLSDLALPPQTLSDLLEALYRTYVDPADEAGDTSETQAVFRREIADRYPKLFATRRGVRTPRVVKAFVLFELTQAHPDRAILNDLVALLPDEERSGGAIAAYLAYAAGAVQTVDYAVCAEEAYDDAQYDRAFEFFLNLPVDKRVAVRLIQCAVFIRTPETTNRLFAAIGATDAAFLASLPQRVRDDLAGLRQLPSGGDGETAKPAAELAGWLDWSQALIVGEDVELLLGRAQAGAVTWDIASFTASEAASQSLADNVAEADGGTGAIAQGVLPLLVSAFFSSDQPLAPNTRPIAAILFDLLAMSDRLSLVDLDLLAQLLSRLLRMGLSSDEYCKNVQELSRVEERQASYAALPWSLDVCESLALEPCPSADAKEARLAFFNQVLAHALSIAHRLTLPDILAFEYLARDFGIDPADLALRIDQDVDGGAEPGADLRGKTIGIYTLMEAAGSRAKAILEAMFEGCRVVVNSDTVATAQLMNLAKTADIFVFAWKSSSHQAFFCVKDAPPKVEPIWAQGKGAASIVRAIVDQLGSGR